MYAQARPSQQPWHDKDSYSRLLAYLEKAVPVPCQPVSRVISPYRLVAQKALHLTVTAAALITDA